MQRANVILRAAVIGVFLATSLPAVTFGAEPSGRRTLSLIPRGWLGNANGRDHSSIRAVFRPIVREARRSTVRILCDGDDTVFGTVVGSDGYIITKNSELFGTIECVLGQRRLPAKLVATDTEYDVALLRVAATDLTAIRWSSDTPRIGNWLATVGPRESPTAIGFVSADLRRIPAARARLGVALRNSSDGPVVTQVDADSAAEKCNLEKGDVIKTVNGQEMRNTFQLIQTIRNLRAGDRIRMDVLRDGVRFSTECRLGISSSNNDQADIMEELAGPLSGRRAGFPLALQHDTVLRPKHCGGPIVDLSGKAVGINIARASRVASYAIPASAAQTLVTKLIMQGE